MDGTLLCITLRNTVSHGSCVFRSFLALQEVLSILSWSLFLLSHSQFTGMMAIHEAGITHRDLKSANVLVRPIFSFFSIAYSSFDF